MSARDYARLHKKWYQDEVLEACADEEPAALWIWPLLIAIGKDELNVYDNETGEIRTTRKRLSRLIRIEEERVESALKALQDGGMLTIEEGRMGTLKITITRLKKWQVAIGSSAEREQSRRDRAKVASREKVVKRDGFVTGRDGCVTQTETETYTNKEITNVILSEKASASADINEVFEHWVKLTYTGRGPKPKLSPKRKQRIKSRLADGWTVEQLKQALDGYARDPFWRGENDGKPKLELAYRLGSTEEIERGLSLHADPARTPMSTEDKWAYYAGGAAS